MSTKIANTTQALAVIRAQIGDFKPEIALILGSGMGLLADEVENPVKIPFSEIPGFPHSTVKGHKGRLVLGTLEGKNVVIMQGRVHYYEGYPMQQLGFPVRVMKSLGADKLIVTNAAGAVNAEFAPGDLMVIRDHINFTFRNPLIGPNDENFGPRFPDNSQTYTPGLMKIAHEQGKRLNIPLHEGVYLMNTGPTYETPAEVNVARFLGADAVGMSTFPEALTANHAGMQVLGISFIGNMAAGISGEALTHAEVIETMELVKDKFIALIRGIVQNM
ncbi:MAG: purine-nucleoside phosphorylase [Bacteroidia bacterium]|nr:purine-nucleoside phosphorylase [Bacteroidia bacterium]